MGNRGEGAWEKDDEQLEAESGVMIAARTTAVVGDSARLARAVIDALSSLIVNIEFLAQGAEGERRAAAEDAGRSLERLAKHASALEALARRQR